MQEALMRDLRVARAMIGVYTREEHWPLPTRFQASCLIKDGPWQSQGTLGGCLPPRLRADWALWFLQHHTLGVHIPTFVETGLLRHMLWQKNATGPVFKVLCTLHFWLLDHAQPGHALGGPDKHIPRIRLHLQWGDDQVPPGIAYTHRPGPWLVACLHQKQWTPWPRCHGDPTIPSWKRLHCLKLMSSALSSNGDVRRSRAWSVMTCQRLASVLAAHIPLVHVLLFAALDSQSKVRKHASLYTVWNVTDVGGPI